MSINIIAAVPLSENRLAVWFDDGVCRRYRAQDLGIATDEELQLAHVLDDGNALAWSDDASIEAEKLYAMGEVVDYIDSEKKRLLKSLSSIRHEAGFSQTRLGEAAGIRQSVISRIEGCEISPQINTLLKLLAPLGKTLAIVDFTDE